ncbi:hypothetical protein HDV00_007822 [Rhizophlyctis rosea]|nr:hypothetical protein HDV00_007822 [Rhizophlyctis rosea]
MLLIGLTGSIATGKSTVSNAFSSLHLPIVDADVIARKVVEPGKPAYNTVVAEFGPGILTPTGTIDRPKLGSIVFQDPEARKKLNAATHPHIRREMLMAVLRHFLRRERACVLDTPLLFEAKLHKFVHKKVVVYCPEDVQKHRLIQRDGLTEEQAEARINSQMPIEQKRAMADIVVDNSGTKEETKKQVEELVLRTLPGSVRTTLVWSLLCIPAGLLYGALIAVEAGSAALAAFHARSRIRKAEKVAHAE